jgi:hypothetical protein
MYFILRQYFVQNKYVLRANEPNIRKVLVSMLSVVTNNTEKCVSLMTTCHVNTGLGSIAETYFISHMLQTINYVQHSVSITTQER